MKTIKRIMAALICMTIALTGIPISVKAADSSGTLDTNMETNSELFITLEENTDYRWNVNDSGEKGSDVHLDTGEGGNCRFRLDKIENGWYGIKHIKVNGTDRFADVKDESKDSGAKIHVCTDSGRQIAEMIYERHEILTSCLKTLGVDAAVAEEDACKIEHVISEESFQAIKDHISKMKDK